MQKKIRSILKKTFWLFEILCAPIIFASAVVLRLARRPDPKWTPVSKYIFDLVGIYPIKDHYYEPYIQHSLKSVLGKKRSLTGVNLNQEKQIKFLNEISTVDYTSEFESLSQKEYQSGMRFDPENGMFGCSDAEFYYAFLRHKKPNKIIEIGSGVSTLVALGAIEDTVSSDSSYKCELTCIEPFESQWLEAFPLKLVREKVEDVPREIFHELVSGDLLFIDSSHVIRHSGDVLTEYLEIIPELSKGVLVHVHDIFTPYNYPVNWVLDHRSFWNEQFILEALLTMNENVQILSATHFLSREHQRLWSQACPLFGNRGLAKSIYLEVQ